MFTPIITRPKKSDYDEITCVWEASVRATHHFLSEEDILFFKPLIRNEYLKSVDLYIIKGEKEQILAFIGIDKQNIEMLFIHPSVRGKGLGKRLLSFAIKQHKAYKVDVNEQNKQALEFYLHLGFQIVSKDDTDESGKPFPILHMVLPE